MVARLNLLMVLLALGIFVADLFVVPLGVAIGVLYVGVVLLSLRSTDRRVTIIAASVVTGLTLVGLAKPTDGVDVSKVLANRGLSVLAIWVTAEMSLREKAFIARQHLDERIRAIVEASPSGKVLVNARGVIVLVNHSTEKLFGYSKGELEGQPIERLVPERLRAHHPSLRDGYFANPQPRLIGVGHDLFGCRRDGSEFPVEIGLNPVRTDEGEFVLASVQDISRQKQAEDRLKEFATRLEASNEDLTDFNRMAVDRELRMIELKTEINTLLREQGKPEKYDVSDELVEAVQTP